MFNSTVLFRHAWIPQEFAPEQAAVGHSTGRGGFELPPLRLGEGWQLPNGCCQGSLPQPRVGEFDSRVKELWEGGTLIRAVVVALGLNDRRGVISRSRASGWRTWVRGLCPHIPVTIWRCLWRRQRGSPAMCQPVDGRYILTDSPPLAGMAVCTTITRVVMQLRPPSSSS